MTEPQGFKKLLKERIPLEPSGDQFTHFHVTLQTSESAIPISFRRNQPLICFLNHRYFHLHVCQTTNTEIPKAATFSSGREKGSQSPQSPVTKPPRPQSLESTYFQQKMLSPALSGLQSWCLLLRIFEMFRGRGEMKELRTLRHIGSHATSISFSSTLSPGLRGT